MNDTCSEQETKSFASWRVLDCENCELQVKRYVLFDGVSALYDMLQYVHGPTACSKIHHIESNTFSQQQRRHLTNHKQFQPNVNVCYDK
jgi:hypothetical protein